MCTAQQKHFLGYKKSAILVFSSQIFNFMTRKVAHNGRNDPFACNFFLRSYDIIISKSYGPAKWSKTWTHFFIDIKNMVLFIEKTIDMTAVIISVITFINFEYGSL